MRGLARSASDLSAELRYRYGDRKVAGRPFLDVFRECMVATGTTVSPEKVAARAERALVLAELLERAIADGEGAVAEAGVWRGFSARLMALSIAHRRHGWLGDGLVLIDSFEGLSPARPEDATDTPDGPVIARHVTNFDSGVQAVREALREFPEVAIHAGWIPPVLESLPERTYRLVHLDTDLFEPTTACLDYFAQRMAPGGVIVDDDYGSERFPGVRRAWDRFVAGRPGGFEVLPSGQCLWSAPRGGGVAAC